MKKVIDAIIIVGFLAVDFLIFHDIFKVGEAYTLPEYLTGMLSILVIVRAIQSLINRSIY